MYFAYGVQNNDSTVFNLTGTLYLSLCYCEIS